ncbi:unnamed protein product [Cuscuta campestris]|uniref:Uncharacterized protein n=1 Tax=Cuscuta campestris TaxID=132261 RepID=A0A484NMD3_9ASTE|nr:unnamed protein product [Cuscuta campestris]
MESFSTDIGSKSKPFTEFFRFTAGGSEDVTKSLGNKPATRARNQRAKTRLPNKFNKVEACNFGEKCHFGYGNRKWEHMRPTGVGQGEDDHGAEPFVFKHGTKAIVIEPSQVEEISRYSKHICEVTGVKFAIKDSQYGDLKIVELEGSSDQLKQAFNMLYVFLLALW